MQSTARIAQLPAELRLLSRHAIRTPLPLSSTLPARLRQHADRVFEQRRAMTINQLDYKQDRAYFHILSRSALPWKDELA